MKKISIILPVYNSEEFIEETILSVLSQTYQNFELIIINDGSSDKSDEICKKISNNNPKIKYYYKDNSGVSATRNYGLSKITGEYVTFIDSDDKYKNNYLEELIKTLKEENVDLGICGYEIMNNGNTILCTKDLKNKDFKESVENLQPKLLFNQIWNKIYKMSIINKYEIRFDEGINIAEDLKFNIKYCYYSKKISYINKPLYEYRISNNGLGFKYRKNSGTIKLNILNDLEKIYDERKYSKEYIYKSYIRQFFSHLSNIVNKKNKEKINEKLKDIKKFIASKEHKKKLKKYKITKCKKTKIILALMSTENRFIAYILGKLAFYYDQYNKKKYYKKLLK